MRGCRERGKGNSVMGGTRVEFLIHSEGINLGWGFLIEWNVAMCEPIYQMLR